MMIYACNHNKQIFSLIIVILVYVIMWSALCFSDREEPMLEERLPDLLPQLRPYQLRAVYWMLQQEKRTCEASDEKIQSELFAPFSVAVTFLEKHSRMFYNPFK